jgi:diaminopimelate decarboxylase
MQKEEKYMKKPFVTKEQVEEISKVYPTPFYVYDEKAIRENARKLKKAFSWNKGFREYFAVKATPNPFILKILQEEGCGVDCSSLTELMLSESLGFRGSDIMFSSNVTPAEEYKKAAKLGAFINLDDYTHIEFLEENAGIPETICCRYNPGGVFSLGTDIMDNPGDAKYGLTKEQMTDAYKKLIKKGAKHFGIHAFLASNTVSNEYYPTLAKILFELAVHLKNETGADISFINLSGGVGIPYTPDKEPNDIMVIGEGVKKAFEEILVPAGLGDVAIFTELGRYMLGPYGGLVTKAIHEKHIYKEYIGVDACAANLMRPAMYGAYHHITVLGKENAPCDHKYDVTGSLCENNDKFAIDRMLPKIDMGDYLFIHDAGAHGYAMGYNYNGRLKSAELLLKEDGEAELIRRAEKPQDYFATFDFCDILKDMKY